MPSVLPGISHHDKQRKARVPNILGQYLLKGWKMMEETCPVCPSVPLMQNMVDHSTICVSCDDESKNAIASNKQVGTEQHFSDMRMDESKNAIASNKEVGTEQHFSDMRMDKYAQSHSNIDAVDIPIVYNGSVSTIDGNGRSIIYQLNEDVLTSRTRNIVLSKIEFLNGQLDTSTNALEIESYCKAISAAYLVLGVVIRKD
jgi:uncharacterized Zn finger protein (UPF0148 family)